MSEQVIPRNKQSTANYCVLESMMALLEFLSFRTDRSCSVLALPDHRFANKMLINRSIHRAAFIVVYKAIHHPACPSIYILFDFNQLR